MIVHGEQISAHAAHVLTKALKDRIGQHMPRCILLGLMLSLKHGVPKYLRAKSAALNFQVFPWEDTATAMHALGKACMVLPRVLDADHDTPPLQSQTSTSLPPRDSSEPVNRQSYRLAIAAR